MSSWDKLFTYETLVHAVAGSVGSMTAMTLFYPLDTVRCRLQLEDKREAKDTLTMLKDLIREEGVSSLYRGLHPVLVSLSASGFVYFYSFHGLRAVFSDKNGGHSAFKDLSLGVLAGTINVLLTTPAWVVTTKMKMQGIKNNDDQENEKEHPKFEGILDGLMKISRQEGISTLWSGTIPSLVLVSNPALQFMVYESLKRRTIEFLGQENVSSGIIFMLGAISKSIATIVTYPLQVVQSKSRFGSEDVKNKRILEIFQEILKRDGVQRGRYRGLESKLLQTVLTTAMMYLTYEKIVAFIFALLLTGRTGAKKVH